MPEPSNKNEPAQQDKSGESNTGSQTKSPGQIVVELEDGTKKELTHEDVKNLVAQQAALTQRSQQVSPLMKLCERYNVDGTTLASNAEAAFKVILDLQEKGVIDAEGNLVSSSGQPATTPQNQEPSSSFPVTPPAGQGDKSGQSQGNIDPVAAKALRSLTERLDTLSRAQDALIKLTLETQIKTQYPDFTDDDVARVIAMSEHDKSGDLWSHAKKWSQTKKSLEQKAREKYAKEFGIDLEKFDENRLRQQEAEGGIALPFKGKKFSFKKGKDTLSPREAMRQHFKQLYRK